MMDIEMATIIARLEIKIDNISQDVADMKVQTTATNGRVKALELWRSAFAGIGACVTLTVMLAASGHIHIT
jgi:hypothetical protein